MDFKPAPEPLYYPFIKTRLMKGKIVVVLIVLILFVSILSFSPMANTKPSQHSPFDKYQHPPRYRDSDADGLYDFFEDENQDGFLTGDEFSLTDPNDCDTDGDGFWDGEEFAYWSCRAEDQNYVPDWLRALHPNVTEEEEFYDLYLPHGDLDGDGHMNILDLDSDNDGIADGIEIQRNTDPANKNISKVLYTDFII